MEDVLQYQIIPYLDTWDLFQSRYVNPIFKRALDERIDEDIANNNGVIVYNIAINHNSVPLIDHIKQRFLDTKEAMRRPGINAQINKNLLLEALKKSKEISIYLLGYFEFNPDKELAYLPLRNNWTELYNDPDIVDQILSVFWNIPNAPHDAGQLPGLFLPISGNYPLLVRTLLRRLHDEELISYDYSTEEEISRLQALLGK